MTFDTWCAAHGVFLNDPDDGARDAKAMARVAWDAAEASRNGEIDRLRGLLERAATDVVRADMERAQIVAAERERIARHFDSLDKGVGWFYDPHEPAWIIRNMGPNAELTGRAPARSS